MKNSRDHSPPLGAWVKSAGSASDSRTGRYIKVETAGLKDRMRDGQHCFLGITIRHDRFGEARGRVAGPRPAPPRRGPPALSPKNVPRAPRNVIRTH